MKFFKNLYIKEFTIIPTKESVKKPYLPRPINKGTAGIFMNSLIYISCLAFASPVLAEYRSTVKWDMVTVNQSVIADLQQKILSAQKQIFQYQENIAELNKQNVEQQLELGSLAQWGSLFAVEERNEVRRNIDSLYEQSAYYQNEIYKLLVSAGLYEKGILEALEVMAHYRNDTALISGHLVPLSSDPMTKSEEQILEYQARIARYQDEIMAVQQSIILTQNIFVSEQEYRLKAFSESQEQAYSENVKPSIKRQKESYYDGIVEYREQVEELLGVSARLIFAVSWYQEQVELYVSEETDSVSYPEVVPYSDFENNNVIIERQINEEQRKSVPVPSRKLVPVPSVVVPDKERLVQENQLIERIKEAVEEQLGVVPSKETQEEYDLQKEELDCSEPYVYVDSLCQTRESLISRFNEQQLHSREDQYSMLKELEAIQSYERIHDIEGGPEFELRVLYCNLMQKLNEPFDQRCYTGIGDPD